jgi:hypothetical protein
MSSGLIGRPTFPDRSCYATCKTAPLELVILIPILIFSNPHGSVEVFFVFHPHANRLFHSTNFMGTLALPPSHPKFPSTPVLHAICAIGSLYTAAVTSPPLPNFTEVAPGKKVEIFTSILFVSEACDQTRFSLRDIESRNNGLIHSRSNKQNMLEKLRNI